MRSASERCASVKNGVLAMNVSMWSGRQSEATTALWIQVALRFSQDVIVIENFQLVYLEPIDRFHLRGPRRSFKPSRRTPRILISHRNQSVLDWILMDVVESGKIRILMRKSCFPEIVPNVASRCIVQL